MPGLTKFTVIGAIAAGLIGVSAVPGGDCLTPASTTGAGANIIGSPTAAEITAWNVDKCTTITESVDFQSVGASATVKLDHVQKITGGIKCTANFGHLEGLDMPALTDVRDTILFEIDMTELLTVKLPLLKTLGSDTLKSFVIKASKLTELNVNSLETTPGSFKLDTLSKLTTLKMDSLQEAKTFEVKDCAELTSLSAPKLTTVGLDFTVTGNAEMNSVNFPVLDSACAAGPSPAEFLIQSNAKLTSLVMDELKTVGKWNNHNKFLFKDMPLLKTVSMRNLKTVDAVISLQGSLTVLETVDWRSLETYAYFQSTSDHAPVLTFLTSGSLNTANGKGTQCTAGCTENNGQFADSSYSEWIFSANNKARKVQVIAAPRKSCHKEVYGISLHDGATEVKSFAAKTCN